MVALGQEIENACAAMPLDALAYVTQGVEAAHINLWKLIMEWNSLLQFLQVKYQDQKFELLYLSLSQVNK